VKSLLEGKVALVTGAFGGLGHEFARMLGDAGASVGLAGRRMTDGRILEAELASQGVHALAVKMEVTDRASVEDAVDKVCNRLGPIDILVNNAGVASSKSFLDQTEDEWNSVIGVNLTGAWRVAQVVARRMRDHGNGGSIINISSVLADAAAKAGLSHLTRAMALELARYNVRVNAMAPGYIATSINRDYLESDAGAALMKRIPQRRFGLSEDLKGVLLLLASEQSSHMTGTIVTIDGGHSISSL
jgi:NAD(P)-dependent dehydrogenase (short-subunit alcohol dehydrogenase family)